MINQQQLKQTTKLIGLAPEYEKTIFAMNLKNN